MGDVRGGRCYRRKFENLREEEWDLCLLGVENFFCGNGSVRRGWVGVGSVAVSVGRGGFFVF